MNGGAQLAAAVLALGCVGAVRDTASGAPGSVAVNDDMSHDGRMLARGKALLGSAWGEDAATAAAPHPTAEALGALAGFGRASRTTTARVSVLLFDSYAEASEADAKLRAARRADQKAVSTVNGPLLLTGTAEAADAAGAALLDEVVSTFAGEE